MNIARKLLTARVRKYTTNFVIWKRKRYNTSIEFDVQLGMKRKMLLF